MSIQSKQSIESHSYPDQRSWIYPPMTQPMGISQGHLDGQVLILMEDQMAFSYACLWVNFRTTLNFLFIKVVSTEEEEAMLLSAYFVLFL